MSNKNLGRLRFAIPSLRMRLVNYILSKRKSPFKDIEALRRDVPLRDLPIDALMPEKFAERFQVERWSAAGQDVITLHPKLKEAQSEKDQSQKAQSEKAKWHIIYFHGGGFFMPLYKEHWPLIAAMAEVTGASVSVPLYKVIPEADYHPANQLADAVYEAIKADWGDERIVLCGDSAGGNLALSLALQRRDAGKSLPARLVPFAPWLDMAMKDDAARAVELKDNMLNIDMLRVVGEWWAGDRGVEHPYASPLYADLAGLPPIAIFQGRHDVCVVDSRSLAARADKAGVPVTLYEYESAPHVYMLLTFTRESKDTLRLMKDFIENGAG